MAPPDSPASALIAELSSTIRDRRVLEAIAAIPRHRFVPAPQRRNAWQNVALPIGCEQTISQPQVVARMLEMLELEGSERVLDVGTGSGYHAALLGRMARHVVSLERHAELAKQARAALAALGVDNVEVIAADGTAGWPPEAPYDAINVAAACAEVPDALVDQLALGGRLIAPIVVEAEQPLGQRLVLLRRQPDGVSRHLREPVRFVPLVPGPGAASGA